MHNNELFARQFGVPNALFMRLATKLQEPSMSVGALLGIQHVSWESTSS